MATQQANLGAAVPSGFPLREERRGHVAILTLANAKSRNPLSEAMIAALKSALDRLRDDAGVRAIVVSAEGPAFSAGHDLKEMTARRSDPDGGRAYFADMMARCATMMTGIVRSPKPVIAAVQGIASAAGCQLVASCDLAVAEEQAQFCTPGVNIGLFCSTPMVALSRNVTRKQAMEMLLLGDMLPAAKALEWGLVNRVVPTGKALEMALALAETIASKSPATVKVGKEAFYNQLEMTLDEAYAYASRVMVENMMFADAKEGIGAFIEKRKPEWQGR